MYDITEYIEKVKNLDYPDLLIDIYQEISRSEEGTSRVKGAVEKRARGALVYADNLKKLAFFLKFGGKPSGVDDFIFESFKPIISNLVEKKQFSEKALHIFNK